MHLWHEAMAGIALQWLVHGFVVGIACQRTGSGEGCRPPISVAAASSCLRAASASCRLVSGRACTAVRVRRHEHRNMLGTALMTLVRGRRQAA